MIIVVDLRNTDFERNYGALFFYRRLFYVGHELIRELNFDIYIFDKIGCMLMMI